jgi:anti-sigma factor (TIGR02949 family)
MDDDIDCNRVIHALYEFLDDELTSEGRRHVESHLHGCPHCYSAFDFEAELRIVVRSRLQVDPPSTLRIRIVAALEQEGLPPSAPPYSRPPANPAARPPLGGGASSFGGTPSLG